MSRIGDEFGGPGVDFLLTELTEKPHPGNVQQAEELRACRLRLLFQWTPSQWWQVSHWEVPRLSVLQRDIPTIMYVVTVKDVSFSVFSIRLELTELNGLIFIDPIKLVCIFHLHKTYYMVCVCVCLCHRLYIYSIENIYIFRFESTCPGRHIGVFIMA